MYSKRGPVRHPQGTEVWRSRVTRGADLLGELVPEDGLTFSQRRRLLRDARALSAGEQRRAHNASVVFDVIGPLDIAVLGEAIHDVWARHDALQMGFSLSLEEARLLEAPAAAGLMSIGQRLAGEVEAIEACRADGRRLFGLERDAKLRVFVQPFGTNRHFVGVAVEHLVCDGESMEIILRDLGYAYRSRLRGGIPAWRAPAPSFRKWAAFERGLLNGGELAERLMYWRTIVDPIEGSIRMKFPGMTEPAGGAQTTAGICRRQIEPIVARQLEQVARKARVTVFSVLAAGLVIATHIATARSVVGFSSPLQVRRAGFQGAVGWLTDIVPIRVRAWRDLSAAEMGRQIFLQAAGAFDNWVPAAMRMQYFDPNSRTGLWDPWLYFDAGPDDEPELEVEGARVKVVREADLGLALRPGVAVAARFGAGGIRLGMQYENEVWTAAQASAFLDLYATTIAGATSHWDEPLLAWATSVPSRA